MPHCHRNSIKVDVIYNKMINDFKGEELVKVRIED